jgi:nitrite reductase (NADH) small subunit
MNKQKICNISDLVKNSGVCALMKTEIDNQEAQIALFYLPETPQQVFAIGNWDPCGNANVMSRGLVCDIDKELVVASPLYKQHFSLMTGKCLEDETMSVPVFEISIEDDIVYLH